MRRAAAVVVEGAEPHELRHRPDRGEVRVAVGLVLVHGADHERDEVVAQALADGAQQRPVGAAAEVPERDGDDAAALRCRERVRRHRDERRVAAGGVLEADELVGHGRDERGVSGRRLVHLREPRAHARRGVVGHLVAVPAPVPELAAGHRVDHRAGHGLLERVEDDDDARGAAAERAQEATRLQRGEPGRRARRQARVGAVRHAARAERDHPRRAQQVLGLVAQDEALERRGQEQHAERRRAAWSARAHGARRLVGPLAGALVARPAGYRPGPWRAS